VYDDRIVTGHAATRLTILVTFSSKNVRQSTSYSSTTRNIRCQNPRTNCSSKEKRYRATYKL